VITAAKVSIMIEAIGDVGITLPKLSPPDTRYMMTVQSKLRGKCFKDPKIKGFKASMKLVL
jgi:hypothetical protein